jgi:hypothetical protein
MSRAEDIEVELIKLIGGDRVLRLTDPASGLSLQRILDSKKAVRTQKERLMSVFEAALAKADVLAA